MAYGEAEIINKIKTFLSGIEYGTVLITIHQGKITQIDRTEKVRLVNDKKSLNKINDFNKMEME